MLEKADSYGLHRIIKGNGVFDLKNSQNREA